MTTTHGTTHGASSINRTVGFVFGAVFLLVALLGFLQVGVTPLTDTNTNSLLLGIFEVNGLHNFVHLGVGALLLGAALKGAAMARQANLLVGVVYLVVGLIGFLILNSAANILSLNMADNFLHLASAAVLIGAALSGRSHAGSRSSI